MVTAILPSLTDETGPAAETIPKPPSTPRASVALSVDSEVTITPERFRNNSISTQIEAENEASPPKSDSRRKPPVLAGYVGLFTGCGALVALTLFLPLASRFAPIEGVTMAQAVQYSFYVVGAVSFLVAIFVFFGLRGLRGEEGKGLRTLLGLRGTAPDGSGSRQARTPKNVSLSRQAHLSLSNAVSKAIVPYWHLLKDSIRLGFTDSEIALGYLGGFVARASTVAISLFMPLFVNTFFIDNGFCKGSPHDPNDKLKEECRKAYILASILTGVAQLMGIICAPIFGYLSSRPGKVNYPIIVATVFGIIGYIAFPQLPSPEFDNKDGRGGTPIVFLFATLIGISQIGAIVCSLGSLGRGVLKADVISVLTAPNGNQETLIEAADGPGDTAPLLENSEVIPEDTVSRIRLKGSVAGVYSWCGGAAILLLTKLGGYLFDKWSTGAPFYVMAVFNGVLLLASLGIDLGKTARRRAAFPL